MEVIPDQFSISVCTAFNIYRSYTWVIHMGHTHGSYTWVRHTGHAHRSYTWAIHVGHAPQRTA
jgi:hypothetical protein